MRRLKASSARWPLMHSHDFVPLGDLCDPSRGITYGIVKVGDFISDGVPVIRGGDIRAGKIVFDDNKRVSKEVSDEFARTILRGGEILINLISEPGHTAIVPLEMAGFNISRDVALIPLSKSVDHRYVDYYLKSRVSVDWLSSRLQGSVTQKINLGVLRELPVPIPPLPQQRAIADALVAFDEKIDLNQRMNETLEAMGDAIFRDWFVDFGPVRRKLAGAAGPIEIMGGLAQDADQAAKLSALFPSAIDGEGTPEGWKASNLGAAAEAVGESVAPSAIRPETPYIGLEHMPRRSIALDTWETAAKVSSQKARFRQGQILFGKLRPYFHKVGIAPTDGVCSTDIVVLDSRKSFDRALVASCVSSNAFVAFTNQASTGTKMPRTSWGQMKSYGLTIADEPVRKAFAEIVSPLHAKIISSILENRTLAETRDYLLPRLMSGEVRVGDAAQEIAA